MSVCTAVSECSINEQNPVVQWLLDRSNPSVRFRTFRDLLERPPDDYELVESKREIIHWAEVTRIFEAMHPDGYWSAAGKHKTYGHSLAYKGYITTPHILHNLAELGLDREHPQTHLATYRYIHILEQEHGFHILAPCIDGYILRALVMMGYGYHPAVQKMIDLIKRSLRWDNGYLCNRHYKHTSKSCMRGTWQVLMAFADVPKLRESQLAAELANYFLDRNVLYRRNNHNTLLRPEVTMTIYPFVHGRASLLEALYGLSKLGYGSHPALTGAWELLEQKREQNGRYKLDWRPATLFPTGYRGKPDKWVTLYALLVRKFRDSEKQRLVD